MIRAIFTDVDGTLLNADRQLSPRTIKAFRTLADKVTVVLASSRMPSAMTHLQHELGVVGHPLICYNGGYVLAGDSAGHVYADHVIPLDVCRGIVAKSQNVPVHISLYQADNWYARHADRWTDKEERVTKVSPQYRDFDTVLAEWERNNLGAHKIMCMGDAPDIAAFYDLLHNQYGDRIHIYKSRPTYLELATRSVSKATGMELVMREILNSDVRAAMAFGDNYNDVEMLSKAGIGIAVDNAIVDAKQVAAEITDSGERDGVAQALERHFGLPENI